MKISATKHQKKPNKFSSQKKAQTQILLTKTRKEKNPNPDFAHKNMKRTFESGPLIPPIT